MAVGAETPPPRGDRHPALVGRHARLVQQGFTEALTLAVCAAGLALLIAWAAVRGLVAIAPAGIPRIGNAALDARMFGFSLCLALLTAVLFGIAPAVLTARRAPGGTMKISGRTATAAASRLRAALVVSEFALSLVLLVGSGLLARSFITVSQKTSSPCGSRCRTPAMTTGEGRPSSNG